MRPRSPPVIALLAAVLDEIEPTLRRLDLRAHGDAFIGVAGQTRLVAAVSGVGASAAEASIVWLLESHSASHLIHLGFAGGLDPALRPGDVPALRWVVDEAGHAWRVNAGVPVEATDTGGRAAAESLLTLDRVADSRAVKRDLAQRHRAALVDMETHAVAAAAARRGLPLTVLRAVCDPAGMALPPAAVRWVRPDGTADVGSAMRYLAWRPWELPALLRLWRCARAAAEGLAEAVTAEVGALRGEAAR